MKILAIGAHYDDIELNCAGTLMKAQEQGVEINLVVCTDGEMGGSPEDRLVEQEKVNKKLKYKRVWGLGKLYFEDGYLKHDSYLVTKIEEVIKEIKPDYLITHTEKDFHQDHIAVAKAVKSANRTASASLITFPSQDIKIPFEANLYVDISKYFDKKLEILELYKSQKDKPWLQKDTITARNIGTGVAKYVEKFHIEFLKL